MAYSFQLRYATFLALSRNLISIFQKQHDNSLKSDGESTCRCILSGKFTDHLIITSATCQQSRQIHPSLLQKWFLYSKTCPRTSVGSNFTLKSASFALSTLEMIISMLSAVFSSRNPASFSLQITDSINIRVDLHRRVSR